MISNLAPAWPFSLNRNSPQARGLYAWHPFHFPNGNTLYDFMQVLDGALTHVIAGAPVWGVNEENADVLTFDGGANDHVDLGDDPNARFLSGTPWSAYIRFVQTSAGDRSLIGHWGAVGSRQFLFRINTGVPEVFGAGSLLITGSTSIANGTRYHALVTNDGSQAAGGLKLYIANDKGVITDNGTSGTFSADDTDATNAVGLGARTGVSGGDYDDRGPFVGDLEEYRYHTVDLGGAVFQDIVNPATRWDLRQVEQPKRYFVPVAGGAIPRPVALYHQRHHNRAA